MLNWVAAQDQARPDAVAIRFEQDAWTFGDVAGEARNAASVLAAHGLRVGDRLGIWLPNDLHHVRLIYAGIWAGLVLVLFHHRWTEAEVAQQARRIGLRWLVTKRDISGMTDVNVIPTDAFDRPGESQPAANPIRPEAPLALMFTSGTTGQPKVAPLTYDQFAYSAMASAYRLGVLPDDRWLSVLPLSHVGGLSIVIRSLLYGTTVDQHRRFDTTAVKDALVREPISLVSLVPTMLHRLLELPEDRWNPALRLVLLGGAAARPDLVRRALARGLPIATTYGATEATSQIATALPTNVRRKPESVGRPLFGVEIRIAPGNPILAADDGIGEILVRGPICIRRYEDEEALDPDGWFPTGDMGYVDEEGDLFVVNRRSDLIITGGENVYPSEVEQAIRMLPEVRECVVVGLADEEWGQRVAALVVLHEGAAPTADDIRNAVRPRLAPFKVPKQVMIVDAVPVTISGKVDRVAARALFSHATDH
jgi:o-succinylbenzoate---CoA ligase